MLATVASSFSAACSAEVQQRAEREDRDPLPPCPAGSSRISPLPNGHGRHLALDPTPLPLPRG
jgi:hypothetical protein